MARPTTIDPAAVAACQAEGMTQTETASKLNISLSSVQKFWKKAASGGRPDCQEAVAELVAAGKTDREIAHELQIAVSTANRQRRAIAAKKNTPQE